MREKRGVSLGMISFKQRLLNLDPAHILKLSKSLLAYFRSRSSNLGVAKIIGYFRWQKKKKSFVGLEPWSLGSVVNCSTTWSTSTTHRWSSPSCSAASRAASASSRTRPSCPASRARGRCRTSAGSTTGGSEPWTLRDGRWSPSRTGPSTPSTGRSSPATAEGWDVEIVSNGRGRLKINRTNGFKLQALYFKWNIRV